jgi:hypothetical protein
MTCNLLRGQCTHDQFGWSTKHRSRFDASKPGRRPDSWRGLFVAPTAWLLDGDGCSDRHLILDAPKVRPIQHALPHKVFL